MRAEYLNDSGRVHDMLEAVSENKKMNKAEMLVLFA